MRAITIVTILACLAVTGCATAPTNQAQTGPSCTSSGNGGAVSCAATIAISAIVKAAQKD